MTPNNDFHYLKNNQVTYQSHELFKLYYPIIGSDAAAVYEFLVNFFDDGRKPHKFSELLNHLQFGMRRLQEALAVLTAIQLVSLYSVSEGYVIKLSRPLDCEAFLQQPVYKRLLEKKIGEVAVSELLYHLPSDAKDISKRFSEVFSDTGEVVISRPKSERFNVEAFQNMMKRDGLSYADEKTDIIALYRFSETYSLNWFETYQIAKATAIQKKLSLKRMNLAKERSSTSSKEGDYTDKEKVILREAKSNTALVFLNKIKTSRRAVMTRDEEKLLTELAEMNFLDEVINVMVLYTVNKTDSANINRAYIMKIANDFAYKRVDTAEDAVLKMRNFSERKVPKKEKQDISNVPDWANKSYKESASDDEKAQLEALKKSMLEE